MLGLLSFVVMLLTVTMKALSWCAKPGTYNMQQNKSAPGNRISIRMYKIFCRFFGRPSHLAVAVLGELDHYAL